VVTFPDDLAQFWRYH